MNNIYSIISTIGGIQGIILSSIFFIKRRPYSAAHFLGAYIFLFSLGLFETYCSRFSSKIMLVFSSFLGFSNFLYGPLLYLFVRKLASSLDRKNTFYHFLPFILGYGVQLFCIFIYNPFESRDNSLLEFLFFEGLVVQILIYNFSAIRVLAKYRPFILNTYSSIEDKDLTWMRRFLIFITAVYILSFIITHLLVLGWHDASQLYVLVQLFITIGVYLMSYRIILQPSLFLLAQQNEKKLKYTRSIITPQQLKQYTDKLLRHLELEKPYLDPDLTIYSLAKKIDMTKNNLTQVINEGTGKNFYELINQCRVDEAKLLMMNGELDKFTISAIGAKVGFKSRTAFFANFKKMVGCTPLSWKNQQDNIANSSPGIENAG